MRSEEGRRERERAHSRGCFSEIPSDTMHRERVEPDMRILFSSSLPPLRIRVSASEVAFSATLPNDTVRLCACCEKQISVYIRPDYCLYTYNGARNVTLIGSRTSHTPSSQPLCCRCLVCIVAVIFTWEIAITSLAATCLNSRKCKRQTLQMCTFLINEEEWERFIIRILKHKVRKMIFVNMYC